MDNLERVYIKANGWELINGPGTSCPYCMDNLRGQVHPADWAEGDWQSLEAGYLWHQGVGGFAHQWACDEHVLKVQAARDAAQEEKVQ